MHIDWKRVFCRSKYNDLTSIPEECPRCTHVTLSRLGYKKRDQWVTLGLVCSECKQIWLPKEGHYYRITIQNDVSMKEILQNNRLEKRNEN